MSDKYRQALDFAQRLKLMLWNNAKGKAAYESMQVMAESIEKYLRESGTTHAMPKSDGKQWQYLPVNPTDEMMNALVGNISEHPPRNLEGWINTYRKRYAEMLKVSPQPSTDVSELQPKLTVRLTSFPESNGKRNWTALLMRTENFDGLIGSAGGISLAHGEFWNRVAYEAERTKFLIGERDTEPDILDYGDDIKTPEEWKGEVRNRFAKHTVK